MRFFSEAKRSCASVSALCDFFILFIFFSFRSFLLLTYLFRVIAGEFLSELFSSDARKTRRGVQRRRRLLSDSMQWQQQQQLPDARCLLPPAASARSFASRATATTTIERKNDTAVMRFVPAAVEVSGAPPWLNVALGPGLQCLEAASLGMPLEVRICFFFLLSVLFVREQKKTFFRYRPRLSLSLSLSFFSSTT